MRSTRFAVAALAPLLLLASCGEYTGPERNILTPEEPVPLPEGEAEIYDGFEELSELIIPEDAEDVEITVNHSWVGLSLYYATFTIDPDGVEEFCNAENFSPYRSNRSPDEEERERFDITEDTVDGMVRGAPEPAWSIALTARSSSCGPRKMSPRCMPWSGRCHPTEPENPTLAGSGRTESRTHVRMSSRAARLGIRFTQRCCPRHLGSHTSAPACAG